MGINHKPFLAPPTFTNDWHASHVASLLNTILLITIAINLALNPVLVLVLDNPTPSLVVNGILLAAQVVLWLALRRGYVSESSFLFCLALWAYVTIISYSFGGYSSLLPTGYVVLALVATILLPRPASYGFYGLTVISLGVIAFLELMGWLPPSLVPLTPAYTSVVLVFTLAAIVALLGLAVGETTEALARAQQELVERSELEAAQRGAEKRIRYLASLLENVSDAVISTDPTATIRSWNRGATAIYGYSAAEAIGQPLADLLPTTFAAGDLEAVSKQLQKQGVWKGEVVQSDKDGRLRHIFASVSLINDPAGNPGGLVTVNRDISERKRAEEALRESEAHLKRAQRIARLGSWELDLQTGKLSWSDEVYRIFETERQAFTATYEAFLSFVHPDDRDMVDQVYRSTVRNRTSYAIVHRLLLPGGQVKHVQEQAETIYDDDGIPLRSTGTVQDITKLKQAEEALRQSERRYRALIDTLEIALCRWLPDTTLTFTNEMYRQAFGIKGEASGQKWLQYLPEGPRGETAAFVQEVAQNPRTVVYEHPVIFEDGRMRHFQWIDTPIFDADGTLVEFQSVGLDITERKQAEEEIRLLNSELEQRVAQRTAQLEAANKELEAFAYSVSHDLRAPLRAMEGFSAALLTHYPDHLDETGRHYLDRIQNAARRMGQLINDLLALSRVTRRQPVYEMVSLSDLAAEIIAELQASEPQRDVDWVIAEGLTVRGDRELLRLALFNLLANGWKFTTTQAQARVEFGAIAAGDLTHTETTAVTTTLLPTQSVYYVRDNGVGFDMAYADKLFTPFQRLHAMAEFPGTGIGLATVQRILARHGGHIWVTAQENQGATFYFTIGDTA